MIKFKIVEVNEAQHSVVARYYTDKITEESLAVDTLDGVIRRCRTDYSIDLPLPTPTGSDLETFILARAPAQWLTMLEAVANPQINTSLTSISGLVGIEVNAPPQTLPTAPISISMSQARLALLAAGHLDTVMAGIAAMPREAQIRWEFAHTVDRSDPLTATLAAALGLDSAALDALFTAGSKL